MDKQSYFVSLLNICFHFLLSRTLAEEHKTSWQEYWPFLDAFADLRSLEGLAKMETFLLKQRVLLLMQTMASWKGGGCERKRLREEEGSQSLPKGTHHKENKSKDIGSGLLKTEEQQIVLKVKGMARQGEENTAPKEMFEGGNCFVPSSAYTVGQQYVLNPDPYVADDLSDSFKGQHTASDDDNDKYFSAESSSDSEEDSEVKARRKQSCDKSEKTNVSPEVPGSHGILGSFWHTLGRLRDYISPRKASPSPSIREYKEKSNGSEPDHQECCKDLETNSSEKMPCGSESVSEKEKGKVLESEENATSEKLRSDAGDELAFGSKKPDEVHSSIVQHSKAMPNVSVISPSTQSAVNYEIDTNKNISLSSISMSPQKKLLYSDTSDLSVQNPTAKCYDSEAIKSGSEEYSNKTALSQWQYRDSQVQILSPERSPNKKNSKLLQGVEAVEGNCQTDTKDNTTANSQASLAVSKEDGQEQIQSSIKSDTELALNDSFNTKLDSLCVTLSKFSFESPTTHSSDSATRHTDSDSPLDNNSSFTSTSLLASEVAVFEPNILLFVGKFYSQFMSSLSPQRCQKFGHEGYWSGVEQDHGTQMLDYDIPTLILHQGQDGEAILADVFLPSLLDGRNVGSVLDLALPIIPEEAHQDAIRGVWVDFMVAFPKSSDVRELCHIDRPLMVKTTIIGVCGDTDNCWTFRFVF